MGEEPDEKTKEENCSPKWAGQYVTQEPLLNHTGEHEFHEK